MPRGDDWPRDFSPPDDYEISSFELRGAPHKLMMRSIAALQTLPASGDNLGFSLCR
ncbi:hypothetical protein MPC4_20162 [Methylocella tundrae]|uniref:Uncharacterized protein n=1 Tax=Methylocella tundrae TaxID=227605 RepID=A0A4U8Z666_METTU|nr:protein of unknown function [Methylocella tundrae]VTZ28261.1 hypothetical protein MPC1_8260002 [Methylocella tundrae]VTZ49952.1 hypothetical protein MPC4_20162 [Methylocella tundrae]